MKRLTRALAAKITAIPVIGMLWTVKGAAFLTGYHPNSILAAIRSGELKAEVRAYYRSRPGGQILRRRYYSIPDWALNAWTEAKILRCRADGNWAGKPGPKARLPVGGTTRADSFPRGLDRHVAHEEEFGGDSH